MLFNHYNCWPSHTPPEGVSFDYTRKLIHWEGPRTNLVNIILSIESADARSIGMTATRHGYCVRDLEGNRILYGYSLGSNNGNVVVDLLNGWNWSKPTKKKIMRGSWAVVEGDTGTLDNTQEYWVGIIILGEQEGVYLDFGNQDYEYFQEGCNEAVCFFDAKRGINRSIEEMRVGRAYTYWGRESFGAGQRVDLDLGEDRSYLATSAVGDYLKNGVFAQPILTRFLIQGIPLT